MRKSRLKLNKYVLVSRRDFNDDVFSNLQFIAIFGTSVLNRPIVAASVAENYNKLLNLLSLELVQVNVSSNVLLVLIQNSIKMIES